MTSAQHHGMFLNMCTCRHQAIGPVLPQRVLSVSGHPDRTGAGPIHATGKPFVSSPFSPKKIYHLS